MENNNTTIAELNALANELVEKKAEKAKLDEDLKAANKAVDDLELKLHEMMSVNEVEKFVHDDKLFYPIVQDFPRVLKEREDDFFNWLSEHGEDGLIKRTVNSQTLRAWYKGKAEEYAEELAEKKLIEVFSKISIGVRKA